MSFIQTILHEVEVGKGRVIMYIVPLTITLLVMGLVFDMMVYHGLNDAQSMDNAQLARQIVHGEGFTTKFLRPYAVVQLHDYAVKNGGELFPAAKFPSGAPHILPDTYNAPGYPYLLAGWFQLVHPKFDLALTDLSKLHIYPGDRPIPWLNQLFMIMTGLLVFGLGHLLFDNRVAWISLLSFFGTDLIWQYSITALSTSVLIFLVTALLFVSSKICCVAEEHFENDEPFWPAWIWTIILGLLLAGACLTRLPLLVLLVPLLIFLALLPRTNFLLLPFVALIVIGLVAPWLWRTYQISGNPIGSNLPEMLYGEDNYTGNQIYCSPRIPSYEQMFKNLTKKELLGFRWHFEHAWELLGSNPMILLFAACVLHQFRRLRANAFRWLLVGSAICIIASTSLATATPEALGPANTLVVLFPGMLVIGTAFFFILLDRLDLQLWVLNNIIIAVVLGLTTLPLILSMMTASSKGGYYNYPPYVPPYITQIAQFSHPDEWVTSDMPWATAWYGDRASLWLPDSIKDFEDLHDNYCTTGVLLLTPITLDAPMTNLFSGEYHDWVPLLTGTESPTAFPFTVHSSLLPLGLNYFMWSDQARWQ